MFLNTLEDNTFDAPGISGSASGGGGLSSVGRCESAIRTTRRQQQCRELADGEVDEVIDIPLDSELEAAVHQAERR